MIIDLQLFAFVLHQQLVSRIRLEQSEQRNDILPSQANPAAPEYCWTLLKDGSLKTRLDKFSRLPGSTSSGL